MTSTTTSFKVLQVVAKLYMNYCEQQKVIPAHKL